MPQPRILLLSRKAIDEQHPSLLAFLSTVPPSMAIAQTDADKDAAQRICETVATFQHCTAIVADFAGCMAVNDDGSTEPIVLPEIPVEIESPLVTLT